MRDPMTFAIRSFVATSILAVIMGLSLAEAKYARHDIDNAEVIAQRAHSQRVAEAGR